MPLKEARELLTDGDTDIDNAEIIPEIIPTRQVGFRKDVGMEVKNEAVLQTETLDGNEPDESAEDAYYGYQGRNRNYRDQNRGQDQNRVNLLRQVRNPARERSRNLNREVWESPSVLRRRGCQSIAYFTANSV